MIKIIKKHWLKIIIIETIAEDILFIAGLGYAYIR